MTRSPKKAPKQAIELSANDVGRYLSRLASIERDAKTGNRALSLALKELSDFLVASKANSVAEALPRKRNITSAESRIPLGDAEKWTLEEIVSRIESQATNRKLLVELGRIRFGIPNSRLQKLSRDDLVRALLSAMEHEQSIEILSDKAKIGGEKRKS